MQLFFELEILCHEFSANFKSVKVINNCYPARSFGYFYQFDFQSKNNYNSLNYRYA